MANRKDPLKKQSDLGLHCLSRPFWQATIVRNFRTSTPLKIGDGWAYSITDLYVGLLKG